jgi:peptide deformylase
MNNDPIVQMKDPVLREKAEYIEPSYIQSNEIQDIIKSMNEALETQNDGVALAAPQVGESYRIFVVAPFVFKKPRKEKLIYINPEIIEFSKEKKLMHEGCLSCRWKIGDVERSTRVTVRAHDEYGNIFTKSADGLLAHIFQHEIDHLHGVLFIDKATNLRDMTQEEISEVINPR